MSRNRIYRLSRIERALTRDALAYRPTVSAEAIEQEKLRERLLVESAIRASGPAAKGGA